MRKPVSNCVFREGPEDRSTVPVSCHVMLCTYRALCQKHGISQRGASEPPELSTKLNEPFFITPPTLRHFITVA